MTIIERILKTAEEKKIKQSDIAKLIDKGTAQITSWKKRGCNPPAELIPPIAKLLNVSINYLMTGEEAAEQTPLPKEEQDLIDTFRRLNPKGKEKVKSYSMEMLSVYPADEERERNIG